MQIDIQTVGIDLADQCRAYVEYRMFSALSRFDADATQVNVRLEQTGSRVGAKYLCVASVVDVRPEGRVRVSATAGRLHAAVDRAAERLSASVERRLAAAGGRASGRRDGSRPGAADPGQAAGEERES
jgi:ribosome-associated translation inhibitor RaiA